MTDDHRKVLRSNLAWWRATKVHCEEQLLRNKPLHLHLYKYRIKQAEEQIENITIELLTGEKP